MRLTIEMADVFQRHKFTLRMSALKVSATIATPNILILILSP